MSALTGVELYISKRIGKAIMDYRMLSDGDRIAVGVSGGKDSFVLLKLLVARQRFVPISYELLAVHVDFGSPPGIVRNVKSFCKQLGVSLHVEKGARLRQDNGRKPSCFWCAWNRRKALFEVADRSACRTVALGHHKDDIIETMLLNLFFHGEISAMSPKQELFDGKLTIIRPLAYVEEDLIKKYVRRMGLFQEGCVCPQAKASNRTRMEKILRDIARLCPDVKTNIFRSLKRIKKEYLP